MLSFCLVHIQPARVNAPSPSSVHLHRPESSICAARMLRGARWVAEQPVDAARRAASRLSLSSSLLPCARLLRTAARWADPATAVLPPGHLFPHLFQVSQKSVYESRNDPRSSARTTARKFDSADTERVCTERSISLDLSRSLMRDSRLLSDDYRGTRRANVTGDPRLQINNSAQTQPEVCQDQKFKAKTRTGCVRAEGRGGGQCPGVLHWLHLAIVYSDDHFEQL